jgi:hypothetical protein
MTTLYIPRCISESHIEEWADKTLGTWVHTTPKQFYTNIRTGKHLIHKNLVLKGVNIYPEEYVIAMFLAREERVPVRIVFLPREPDRKDMFQCIDAEALQRHYYDAMPGVETVVSYEEESDGFWAIRKSDPLIALRRVRENINNHRVDLERLTLQ